MPEMNLILNVSDDLIELELEEVPQKGVQEDERREKTKNKSQLSQVTSNKLLSFIHMY